MAVTVVTRARVPVDLNAPRGFECFRNEVVRGRVKRFESGVHFVFHLAKVAVDWDLFLVRLSVPA